MTHETDELTLTDPFGDRITVIPTPGGAVIACEKKGAGTDMAVMLDRDQVMQVITKLMKGLGM